MQINDGGQQMGNILRDARIRREQKRSEVESLGFVFLPSVDLSELSMDELNDLADLAVGESTFIIINETGFDVTRIS
jgi:hypothetical protein